MKAVCSKCSKIIECKGSTTTALINHLKIQGIIIEKSNMEEEVVPTKSKIESYTILKFVEQNSLGAILSRCATKDWISVRAMKNYLIIRILKCQQVKRNYLEAHS